LSESIHWGRRRLLRLAAWSGLAPFWLASASAGDDPANKKGKSAELPPKSYLPPAPVPPEPKPAQGPSDAAKELAALARRRYGAYLDEAQMKELTTELDDGLDAGEKLRKVKLANSDEPDVTFRAG
jgi:hypothetical protein